MFVLYVRACVRVCARAVTSLHPHFKDVPKRDLIYMTVTLAVHVRVYFDWVLRLTVANSKITATSQAPKTEQKPLRTRAELCPIKENLFER